MKSSYLLRICLVLLLAAAGFLFQPVSAKESLPDETCETTQNKAITSYTIGVGERIKLSHPAVLNPEDHLFESSDESIVHAGKRGRITGMGKGQARVIIRSASKKVLTTIKVTVKQAPKVLQLNNTAISLYKNGTAVLSAKTGKKAACNQFTFHSSKPSVATVTKTGTITAHSRGKCSIKVQTYNGLVKRCQVTVKPSDKVLALSFDDGPVAANTSRLLAALKKYDCHSTFFMVGYEVPQNAALLKTMLANGNELGMHSYRHNDYAKMTRQEVLADLTKTSSAIFRACGQYPTVMRPPYGSYNNDTLAAIKEANVPAILWNVDIKDWQTTDASKIKNDILKQSKDGAVFVLHDARSSSVDAVISAIPELKKQGYELVTISQLAAIKGISLKAGDRFYGKF